MKRHITLLGDSIFDNKIYVPDGLSVYEHLTNMLTDADKASLVAVDGAVISSVFRQVERIPEATTHLVLSVGGNDALHLESSVFEQQSDDIRDALAKMKASLETFQCEYAKLIETLLNLKLPLAVCTVYDSIPGLDDAALCGLAIINDIITRIAFENSVNLIDLRVLCDESKDYSAVSPIEPSHQGGQKISHVINQATSEVTSSSSQVFKR
ncbi:hypothetical protein Q31b_37510 [Novipirellula aureliae]|uniref:SGNH hydrolase-type esterase domain-containing protein n=1 Tax=Novipirellula aureliae TaxID=2527966 RepID=A0A5C6DMY5_9BACT|nr:SGNH/GDSL hydrolase family protein [Novipirellula aureliae]TWU38673.1 hypothetical protein Q31b_37510 [Novipirellula aureliae]